jgi:hypothetical protein
MSVTLGPQLESHMGNPAHLLGEQITPRAGALHGWMLYCSATSVAYGRKLYMPPPGDEVSTVIGSPQVEGLVRDDRVEVRVLFGA